MMFASTPLTLAWTQPTMTATDTTADKLKRQQYRTLDRRQLNSLQLGKLNRLLDSLTDHPLYRKPLSKIRLPLQSLDELNQFPLLTKSDLAGPPPQPTNHPGSPRSNGDSPPLFSRPPESYVRYHQTSGSRGWPMPILDTRADWNWWIQCWQYVLDAADVDANDIAMMAFSFGPFIGFWSANDALVHRGTLVVPGGGLTTLARLHLIQQRRCTVLCCTPTYALHMASVASQNNIDLSRNDVSRIIVAGEPGGSVPSVRNAIQSQWGARVIDHAGASEIGAWGFASEDHSGLHVIESEFIAEFLIFDSNGNYRPAQPLTAQPLTAQPLTAQPVSTQTVSSQSIPTQPALNQPISKGSSEELAGESSGNDQSILIGERSELVITNLGRDGGPVVRYRTGDIVTPVWDHSLTCRFVHLPGGVLGRADDMLVIRGVNVFPSSVEAIVRQTEPTAEFRMIASEVDSMDQLRIELEVPPESDSVAKLEQLLRQRLALRVPVTCVPVGSLPRSEAKSKRWIDERKPI
ncbi:Phenylacetate-coenzyme A ligase PaaK, adenylate-forming domain family [Neorhodopirellula lusitana]|uniref:Phenylacetate-coenzyme A ligase PaaK, adenylate-forming domain family n=2 Tax=Neorhodopirellula lusitana TaxID=445327 RepID=A0ABY1Q424_9BACT|nr:Phenylacetate-coenzyme A ligase PaaK, adenylate-forming domain family [Neorhodopirellula lusitana]